MFTTRDLRENIVRPVLQHLDMWSEAAENLMLGTAAQESHMGRWVREMDGGPALGIFQINPGTHRDTWDNYLKFRPAIKKKVLNFVSSELTPPFSDQILIENHQYAAAIARIKYFRVSKPLPAANDIPKLAEYWKVHYNTHVGDGKAVEFERNYKEYILGKH